jgi:hypothetical protein
MDTSKDQQELERICDTEGTVWMPGSQEQKTEAAAAGLVAAR